jgi:hypothetical protein
MTDDSNEANVLRRLGVILDICEGCGDAFDVRRTGLHKVVLFDSTNGEIIDEDTGFFCTEQCAKKNEARRRANGASVVYHHTDLP